MDALAFPKTQTATLTVGALVVFEDYAGERFTGRLVRELPDGEVLVRGNGLDQHKYWGVTIARPIEKVWAAE